MVELDCENINAPHSSIREWHGYLDRAGKHLFAAKYIPGQKPRAAVILCGPFAEEKVRTLRIYVSLARALAQKGVAAVCFDYYGDGDSEGVFEDASFEDRMADIRFVHDQFKEEVGADIMMLMGLRWGGTLAAHAAEELHPKALILWEPVIDTAKYFYDHLRSFLASQMLIDGKASTSREELVKELEAGKSVTVEGYNLSGAFFVRAREMGLKDRTPQFLGQTLIAQIAPNPARIRPELETLRNSYKNCELVSLPREFEWEKTETWRPAPPRLFMETFKFLDRHALL